MAHALGIDLGSTTSKAVLLDEQGNVAGLGLTNTRSNYDVAAQVARAEALLDAELSRLAGALASRGPEVARQATAEVRRAVRVEEGLRRLGALGKRVVELVAAAPGGQRDADRLGGIFSRMADGADALLRPLAEDRSRFFRDVVGGAFLNEVEEASRARELSYDLVVGAYDRAIVECENAEAVESLPDLVGRALSRARLDGPMKDQVRGAFATLQADPIRIGTMVGTGYGRQRLPFPKDQIRSEILCHGLGAHASFPATRTVLDIGGQDTKAIQVDERGVVTSFQMNDRCAAGCGRYLGYIAEEMNLGIQELGPLAMKASRAVRITSTCTVFAGVELRERLSLGEKRENILLGLHRAIVLRAMSLLARSGGVSEQLTFTGGVAKNPAVVQELRQLVTKHYGQRTLNIHPDSIYTGALGAAIFAWRVAGAGAGSHASGTPAAGTGAPQEAA